MSLSAGVTMECEGEILTFKVFELAEGLGSRESARKVRNLVENVIDANGQFVTIDFAGVDTCSSAFIDELLAKLIVKYGFITYPNYFKVANLTGQPAELANISAAQRLTESPGRLFVLSPPPTTRSGPLDSSSSASIPN